MTESRYIHGSTPEEQQRLSGLNDWLNRRCLRQLSPEPGDLVLDLGCGLGQFSREIARAVLPKGRVTAVERDPAQFREACRRAAEAGESRLVDFREGDATRPPLDESEWGSFDVAHCRFLLEHLPRPEAAVEAMFRALRPGGRLVLMDDDHELFRFAPPNPAVEKLWRAYIESYRVLGNDPCVGRRLVSLLHQAGAAPAETTFVPYTHCRGSAGFEAAVENVQGVVESARGAMLENGLLSTAEYDECIREYRRWSRLPDAALWYCLNWAEGRKP